MPQSPYTLAVRRLRPDDSEQMAALRREALTTTPLAFGSSPEGDRFNSMGTIEEALAPQDRQAVFGLQQDSSLQGMAGVCREQNVKERHKAFIWGMYVRPEARGRGGGGQLLRAAVAWARQLPDVLQVHLSVTEASAAAHHLYLNAGFVEWGVEPRALCWQGRFTAERHLVLHLDMHPDR